MQRVDGLEPENFSIQQALANQYWNDIDNQLRKRCYQGICSLDEIESLLADPQAPSFVKNAAILYLVAHAPLKKLQTLSATIFLKCTDSSMRNAVHIAAANGRVDVLEWLLEDVKLPLNMNDASGFGPVLYAVAGGQLHMLRLLTRIAEAGGYELSLDVCGIYHRGPLHIAILNERPLMLEWLLRSREQGGFGLEPINLSGLIKLAKNESKPKAYVALFMHAFEAEVFALNANDVISIEKMRNLLCMVEQMQNTHEHYCASVVNERLAQRYEDLLKTYCLSEKITAEAIAMLADVLETLSPGLSRFMIAERYEATLDFIDAYKHYLSIFEDDDCSRERRQAAGIKLAEMIFRGEVVFTNDKLDESLTVAQQALTLEQRKTAGEDKKLLRERALPCYRFLHGNTSEAAKQLQAKVDKALASQLGVSTSSAVWSIAEANLYVNYQAAHHPEMLPNSSLLALLAQLQQENQALRAQLAQQSVATARATLFQPQATPMPSSTSSAATPDVERTLKH